ncbi:mucin-2-like [Aedes albopictus]|uniref:Uncharacterized protein n=1 Tax=Aedes albopictus TaxID=7160 RepID=A0ABM1XVR4_AEDAL
MVNIERLFAQRNLVEEELKKLKRKICEDGVLQPSLARRMLYERQLQCHYKEYRRVCFELLSTLPPERHDELDKDASHFEDIYTDACILVEKIFHSFPSTGDTHQNDRTPSSCFTATTAPRWRTPPIRSRSTYSTTEHPVPILAETETPRTSFPNKIKVSTIVADSFQHEKPPHDEDSTKNINPPTSQKYLRVGNDPTEFVNRSTEDSKTMTIPIPTGLGPVRMPFRPPPGFHPAPKRNAVPTGMPPVSHYSTGCSPVPQPLQSTTGSQPVSQPLQSTTGSTPVFHPLQCKTDSFPTSQQSRYVTGSCRVLQIPYVTESFPTSKLPTPMTELRPVQEQYPCAEEPNSKRPDVAGIPPVLKPFLSTVEVSPVTTPALMPIGASPVKKSAITPVDARSATKPTMMSAGPTPVAKPISPSAGSSPVGSSAPMAVGFRPMVKPTPMSIGTSPVGSSAQRSTGTNPVVMPIPISTGTSSVGSSDLRFTDANSVIKSALMAVGTLPMVKPTPMSAGGSPVGNSAQRSIGTSPVVTPIPMFTGTNPVGNSALRLTDARSVIDYDQRSIGTSPVIKPTLWSANALPVVNSAPMSVGPFPAVKPTLPPIEANPPPKSTGTSPVVKPTVISTGAKPEAKPFNDSADLCPVAKPSPKPNDLRSVTQSNPTSSSTVAVNPPAPTMKINETNRTKKRTPPIAGTRPRNRVQSRTHQVQTPKTTEIRPATSCALMPSGIRPITRTSTRKQWIVVALKFGQPPLDPPPVNATGVFEQLHSDTLPRKPPDVPSKQIRPSEAIVERVSRMRPPKDPIKRLVSILPPILAGEYVRANAKW